MFKLQTNTNAKIWFGFIFFKFIYMIFAIGIVSKITILGDTFDYFYLNKPQFGTVLELLLNSTNYMNIIGHNLYLIVGPYIANIPFIFLSVYGIYYPLKKIKHSNKQLFFLLGILSLPSFGIWTSICSKESIGVFFMGIILGYCIDIIEEKRIIPNLLELIAFFLLLIFKTQYFPAILSIILFTSLSNKFGLKKEGKTIFFFLTFITLLIVFYLVRDYAQTMAEELPRHFSMKSNSTRENTFWIQQYDIYYYAIKGMYISFMGPTINEALNNNMQLLVFFESYIILFFFIMFFIRTFIKDKTNLYLLYLTIIPLVLILVAHYPFGIFNPGSAVRYRENFYGFLVIYFYFIFIKSRPLNLFVK